MKSINYLLAFFVITFLAVAAQAVNASSHDLVGHVRIEITGRTPIEITYDVRKPDLDSCTNLKKSIAQTPIEMYGSSKAYKAIGVNTLSGNLAEALQGAGSIKLWDENTLGGAANAVKVVHLGCYPVHAAN